MLTCEGEAGELEGEGDATAEKLGNGGGSGRAWVWSGRGSYRHRGRKSAQYKLDEPLANQKRTKEGRSLSFTGGDEDTAAAKNRGGGNGEWRVLERVCLQEVGKGASRSSSTTLNSHQEREGGEGRRRDHETAGACH
jgi:hypothetical protein